MPHAHHEHRPGRIQGGAAAASADDVLLKIVDFGLAAAIFVVPLLMGGRHGIGQLVLVALAAIVAVAWMLRQCCQKEPRWRRSPAEWLLAAGLLLLGVQVFPCEESWLRWLAPHMAVTLPLWTSGADPSTGLETWQYVSMTPGATRAAIPLWIAYGLLVLVTVQRIRGVEDVERLLRWIAESAVIMACFGLAQWIAGNGKFFWFYEYPFSSTLDSVTGSFTNRNHFAHFLALGLGPMLAWLAGAWGARPRHEASAGRLQQRQSPDLSALGFLAVGIVLFAGFMSLSRGGAVAIVTAAAVAVAVGYRAKAVGGRFVLGLTAVALVMAVALAIRGYGALSNRLSTLTSGSVEVVDHGAGRRTIWTAVAKAVPHYLLFGSGVGSHAEIYPMYLDAPLSDDSMDYTHAENSPLQLLLETGLIGLGLMFLAIGLCGFWCLGACRAALAAGGPPATPEGHRPPYPARRILSGAGAISASLAASLVHGLVDFVWYVPACMMLVALMAGCAFRLWQLATDPDGKRFRRTVVSRPLAVAVLLVLAVIGAWQITNCVGPAVGQIHWDRYKILEIAADEPPHADSEPAEGADPSRRSQAAIASVTAMIAELEEVVQWDPDHARVHLCLADAYVRRFDLAQQASENAMSLGQLADTVVRDPQLSSREKIYQWLSRVAGPRCDDLDLARQQAHLGLSLGPTQPAGYVCLAQLTFLDGPSGAAAKRAYIAQALTVGPFNGAALLEAGKAASLAGDLSAALDYWRQAIRSSPVHRGQLIELLAGHVPIGFFLEAYQPDLMALRTLNAQYSKFAAPTESRRVCMLYHQFHPAATTDRGEEAAAAMAWFQDQLTVLRRHYLDALESEAAGLYGPRAASAWLEAGDLCQQLGDSAGEFERAEKALCCDPTSFNAHLAVAQGLIAGGRFTEAESHLSWCLQRRPQDQGLQSLLHETVKKRINREDRTAGANGQTVR